MNTLFIVCSIVNDFVVLQDGPIPSQQSLLLKH